MPCTEAYKEHIEYTFNAFCRVVIHYAAINAWRDRDKRRQREISFEYLTEEKFYPFCTSDTYFIDPYKQYPVTICGQRVILTNVNLAEALSSLPEKKREIIYLYFSGVTHSRKSGNCTDAAGVRRGITYTVPCKCCMKKWRCCPMSSLLLPYDTIIKAHEGDPIAIQAVLDRYAGYIRYFSKMNGYYNSDMEDYIRTKLIESLFKFRLDR